MVIDFFEGTTYMWLPVLKSISSIKKYQPMVYMGLFLGPSPEPHSIRHRGCASIRLYATQSAIKDEPFSSSERHTERQAAIQRHGASSL